MRDYVIRNSYSSGAIDIPRLAAFRISIQKAEKRLDMLMLPILNIGKINIKSRLRYRF